MTTTPREIAAELRRFYESNFGEGACICTAAASRLEELGAENKRLRDSLTETLRALEAHLDETVLERKLSHRSLLCACHDNEVQRARAALEANP